MNWKITEMVRVSRLVLLPVVMGLATPALAGGDFDTKEPARKGEFGIKGKLSVELQTDTTFDSDDPGAELTDTYNTTELGVEVTFNRFLTGHGAFTFEPVLDPGPGEDRFFEDEGLYAEELFANVALGRGVNVFGGKFNPAFGQAWDVTPGVYGVDFAEDYEIAERLGFGASIERENTRLGTVTLTGSVYHLDTSGLSRSAFTDRGRRTLADGGASNTENLDSFALALDAVKVPSLGGANLHFAYRFQHKGIGIDDLEDEHGFVAGINGSRSMNGVQFNWIGEIAHLDNAEGTRDDLWYYTVGGVATFANKYNIAVSYTGRPRDVAGGSDLDDMLFQVSAGVGLRNGWTVDAGYKYHVENDMDNHTVGVLLAKSFSFGPSDEQGQDIALK